MDEKGEELEKFLLLTTQNDGELVIQATEYISTVMQEENAIEIFFSVIQNSKQPVAVSQAIIQSVKLIKIRWKTMDEETRNSIATFFLTCLCNDEFNECSMNQIIGALSFFFSNYESAWGELIEYITTPQENPFFFCVQINVFSKCIKLFTDEQLGENIELFSQMVFRGLNTGNWATIFFSMQIMADLMEINIEAMAPSIEFVASLIESVVSQGIDIQIRFFELVSFIVGFGEPTGCIIEQITSVAQSEEIDPCVSIAALNSLTEIVGEFDGEQIDNLLNVNIQQASRSIEATGELSEDLLSFVSAVINSFPHASSYSIIKEKINAGISEATEAFVTASIMFAISCLECAPEVFVDEEVTFISSLIQVGFESESLIAIESACNLIKSSMDVKSLSVAMAQFIPSLIQYISSEESNIAFTAIDTISAILELNSSHDDSTLSTIWEIREAISEENVNIYLHCLQNCIRMTPQLETEFINTAFEFITQYITEPIENIDIASNCLSIISAIIFRDESQTEKLALAVPVIAQCFEDNDMNTFNNALRFLSDISVALGENAAEFLSQYIPMIKKILKTKKKGDPKIIQKAALESVCKIIRHSHIFDLLGLVTKLIRRKLRTNDENKLNEYLPYLRQIIKFMKPKYMEKLYPIVTDIAYVAEDEDLLSTCFLCLTKFINHCPEDLQSAFLESGFELCNSFVEGELPALKGKQLTDPDVDLFTNIVEDFSDFAASVAGLSSEVSEQICRMFLSVAEAKPYEEYREIVLSVYIVSIEKETATQESIQALLDALPSIIETATPNITQHDSVYMLNILINKFPDIIEQLKPIIPSIIEWWNYAYSNYSSYRMLGSNIASFIFNYANRVTDFPIEVVKQALSVFPPEDITEVASFSSYVLAFMTSHECDAELQIIAAKGLAQLLTSNQSTMQKMKMSQELVDGLVAALKQICSNEENLKAANEAVSCSEGKLAKLGEILS